MQGIWNHVTMACMMRGAAGVHPLNERDPVDCFILADCVTMDSKLPFEKIMVEVKLTSRLKF